MPPRNISLSSQCGLSFSTFSSSQTFKKVESFSSFYFPKKQINAGFMVKKIFQNTNFPLPVTQNIIQQSSTHRFLSQQSTKEILKCQIRRAFWLVQVAKVSQVYSEKRMWKNSIRLCQPQQTLVGQLNKLLNKNPCFKYAMKTLRGVNIRNKNFITHLIIVCIYFEKLMVKILLIKRFM